MISVFSSNNLLKPITDFLANNTRLKTPYLTALPSTSLSTTILSTALSTIILSTKYTIVLSLEEERARK